MGVGPKDRIDEMLVRKYATVKVDNPSMNTLIDSKKMLETMEDYATMHRNMLILNQKLKDACSAVNTKSAIYKTRKRITPAT